MDFTEITACINAAKAAVDCISTLRKSFDKKGGDKELLMAYGILLDLQEKILSIREESSQWIDIRRSLEKQLAEYDNWEQIKARYQLQEWTPESGVFVYSLKEEFQQQEPLHYLCPSCVEKRQKGIISKKNIHKSDYHCPLCGWEFSEFKQAKQVPIFFDPGIPNQM